MIVNLELQMICRRVALCEVAMRIRSEKVEQARSGDHQDCHSEGATNIELIKCPGCVGCEAEAALAKALTYDGTRSYS